MSAAREHASRRAAAADMVPINARRSQKRPLRCPSASARERPSSSTPLAAARGVPELAEARPVGPDDPVAEAEAARSSSGPTRAPDVPPGALPRDENGQLPLLQSRAGIDADESYGSQEHALSSYLKLHPVLSLESTSFQTLQLVADLVADTSIPTKALEIVSKSHDDGYLRRELHRPIARPCS